MNDGPCQGVCQPITPPTFSTTRSTRPGPRSSLSGSAARSQEIPLDLQPLPVQHLPTLATDDAAAYGDGHTTATATDTDDHDVIERREERLVVDKDVEKAGEVRIGKNVVEDRQAVDVPVSREEVNLERRAVDRPATGDSLTDESIDVPVYEERVKTGKEARVVEELEVGKTATTDTKRVEDTVRREEFEIEDDTRGEDRP
jgi:uncharacterized protein (TIGR02271 family)